MGEFIIEEGHGEIHIEEGKSLTDFIWTTAMVLRSDSPFQVHIGGSRTFPGERDVVPFTVASEEGKKVARSILKALWNLELLGICLEDFTAQNILVTPSLKAKFIGVTILRNLQGADFLLRLRANYSCARVIIQGMYGERAPEDIVDLLLLMENVEDEGYNFNLRLLCRVHPSLLPIADYDNLFKEFYDHILFRIPEQELNLFLDDMNVALAQYVTHWRARIATNDLLLETYDHKGGDPYQRIGVSGPNKTKLTNTEKVILDLLRVSKDGKHGLNPDELARSAPLQFLIFLRNRPAHRMDKYQAFVRTHKNQQYISTGSQRVTHARFPRLLAYLQRWLFNRNLLWSTAILQIFRVFVLPPGLVLPHGVPLPPELVLPH